MNSTRRRSSGTRHALASQESRAYSSLSGCARPARQPRRQPRPRSGSASSVSSARRAARRGVLLDLAHLRLLEQRQRAAGRLDLLARGRRGAVHGDRELLRELADAEQLHVLAHRADQALRLQRLGRDLLARLEAVEVADVHRLGVGAERADRHRVLGRVAAQLRDAHRERHLAALEAGAHRVRARARLLALDPAAGVAALARAQAAADALAVLARLRRAAGWRGSARRPSDLLDLHEMAHLAKHACDHRVLVVLARTCRSGRGRARAACRGGAGVCPIALPVWVTLSFGIGRLLLGRRRLARRRLSAAALGADAASATSRRRLLDLLDGRPSTAARRARPCRAPSRRPRGGAGRAAPARRPSAC